MMGFGLFFMMLIWGIIIVGAIWIGRYLLNLDGELGDILSTNRKKSALDILENRYARGEITREEFETMREDLA